jgi:hypothetical protein
LDEDVALGGGWADSPATFDRYKDPRPARTDHQDPLKWVDDWPVSGLSSEHRKKIKAQLLRADAAFWKSTDADSAGLASMKLVFEGVAQVLFDARILTEQLLQGEIPALVWDSAIAGGWYRFASETPERIFPEPLRHYHVWRDEAKDWKALFRVETAEWLAQLLEVSPDLISASEANDPEASQTLRSEGSGQLEDFTVSNGPRISDGTDSAGTPEDRLSRFVQEHPGTTYADIKFSSMVHTAEFQDWRRGKLKPTSVMFRRIEDVLSGVTALKKRPPKPRSD